MLNIDPTTLPTHLALVARRLNLSSPDDAASVFLETSYLAEAALKTVAIALCAGLKKPAPEIAYRHGYNIIRADGLGTWEVSVRDITSQPTAAYLPTEFATLLAWVIKKRTKVEDEWLRVAYEQARQILRELGSEDSNQPRHPAVRDFLSLLVQIRNKTKAHGAVGPDFYAVANAPYLGAVNSLVTSCPAFGWRWMHLSLRANEKIKGIGLSGLSPRHLKESEANPFTVANSGIYFAPDQSPRAFWCGDLIRCNPEFTTFFMPNGGVTEAGDAEFIDYGSGKTTPHSISEFVAPPASLPPSDTEGADLLDVQSNVFGNLPDLSAGYVRRPALESELTARLLDKNHPVVTLHGGGGMGKTSLAICVAHDLAKRADPPFEHIVWFSARDVDLRPTGPAAVRQAIVDLSTVSRKFSALFSHLGVGKSADDFAKILQSPDGISPKGLLFVFDNFETLEDVRGFHQFLDQHTHLPNKVLITSRERAFKADYPIEVRGMEPDEARKMLTAVAQELSIEGLMTDTVVERIFEFTGGHAYVMRVIAGEMAKEGRYSAPPVVMGRRTDIVDAVFQRSFNKLSEAGRHVFLVVSNWKANVSELALLVVLGVRGIDAENGLEECLRLSLISPVDLPGGLRCFTTPQLARAFGQKKLNGDPDKMVIQVDLLDIQKFGVLGSIVADENAQQRIIHSFVEHCFGEVGKGSEATAKADRLLEALAAFWPGAWLELAEFRIRVNADKLSISYALRRAVEEQPLSKAAWLKRADFEGKNGDEAARIASLVSAVETAPSDVDLIREVAYQLCKYVIGVSQV